MSGWRCLVDVAAQTVDRRMVGIHDDHRYGGSGRRYRVNVSGGVMTSRAKREMGGQDVWPILNRVTVGAWLRISLTKISWAELDRMVNSAAG